MISVGLLELLKIDILEATSPGRCENMTSGQSYESVCRRPRVPSLTVRTARSTCGTCVPGPALMRTVSAPPNCRPREVIPYSLSDSRAEVRIPRWL